MAINGQTVLAIIPARGGSRRVPRKNGRVYRGRMLFSWTIDAALKSKYLDKTLFSSDEPEWLSIASIRCDCIVRPAELATDTASSEDVIRHALSLHPADWVVLLQPTSPLRTAEDIDACIERAQMGDGCISVNRATGRTNGAVYVARSEWLAKHDFSHLVLMKCVMPEERSLDIDNEEDFQK